LTLGRCMPKPRLRSASVCDRTALADRRIVARQAGPQTAISTRFDGEYMSARSRTHQAKNERLGRSRFPSRTRFRYAFATCRPMAARAAGPTSSRRREAPDRTRQGGMRGNILRSSFRILPLADRLPSCPCVVAAKGMAPKREATLRRHLPANHEISRPITDPSGPHGDRPVRSLPLDSHDTAVAVG
jgi:hypothetical protein